MVSDGTYYFEYNGMNMLERVRLGNEVGRVIEEYWYDHEGKRSKKTFWLEDGRIFDYLGGGSG